MSGMEKFTFNQIRSTATHASGRLFQKSQKIFNRYRFFWFLVLNFIHNIINFHVDIAKLKKNRLIKYVTFLAQYWKLSFQIKPLRTVKGWSSILHATIGKNNGRFGDRTPGIWFHGGSTKLHICSAINGNPNRCYNSKPLPRNKFSTILIQQVRVRKRYGQKYMIRIHFQVFINNKKVVDVVNQKPKIFRNVRYYAGDPWFQPAFAILRNFRLRIL